MLLLLSRVPPNREIVLARVVMVVVATFVYLMHRDHCCIVYSLPGVFRAACGGLAGVYYVYPALRVVEGLAGPSVGKGKQL